VIRVTGSISKALLLAAFCGALAVTPARAADDDDEPAALPTVMADFNRDGLPDMAKVTAPAGSAVGSLSDQTSSPDLLTIWLGQPDGSFRPMSSHLQLGHQPRSLLARDFNGDGIPDLILGDGDGSVTEFLGDGAGNFVATDVIARFDSVASVAVGDLNRDGIPDLAVSDPTTNAVTVLLGVDKGAFRAIWTEHLIGLGKISHIAVADFTGDGVPDLAVTGDDDQYMVLLGNGNGSFTYQPLLSNVKDPNSHCAA